MLLDMVGKQVDCCCMSGRSTTKASKVTKATGSQYQEAICLSVTSLEIINALLLRNSSEIFVVV